ncbi:hypothetical protein ACHAW5_000500 [Stephanodiscus triporus]|uniref:Uncharacterized protein n=1 Tax=Stephanodiscus triporus TaxID=2934178 RepID=A0ABD3NBS9_9STRA
MSTGANVVLDRDDERSFRPTRYHKSIEYSVNRRDLDHANDDVASSSWPEVRVSLELHDPKSAPLTNVFNPLVLCPLGEVTIGRMGRRTGQNRTGGLPPSLVRTHTIDRNGRARGGRVLDFTASMSTDLKLLFVGDSVLVQLAQAVDEFLGGRVLNSRTVLWECWAGHEGGSVVAPTRGGGVSAMWRMTGLLSMANRGKPPANSGGGGWSDAEIDAFLNHTYRTSSSTAGGGNSTIVGSFDVVVIRVMHGWMELHEITHERIVEAVELCHELLGATTVVLMTVPFSNNVKTAEDMARVKEINDDMRTIARTWHSRTNGDDVKGVQHVLVLEYGMYFNHIIWSNARHLNYSVTSPLGATPSVFDLEGPKFLLDRLDDKVKFPPSAPMICSSAPNRGKCNRNSLFRDGMHICPETLASRYASGIACVLGCVYNRRRPNSARVEESIRMCESECNEQFLSVMPVEESWIDTHTTLASFSD